MLYIRNALMGLAGACAGMEDIYFRFRCPEATARDGLCIIGQGLSLLAFISKQQTSASELAEASTHNPLRTVNPR